MSFLVESIQFYSISDQKRFSVIIVGSDINLPRGTVRHTTLGINVCARPHAFHYQAARTQRRREVVCLKILKPVEKIRISGPNLQREKARLVVIMRFYVCMVTEPEK